jgi:DNA-binding transcriptional MocR family regulator
MKKLTDQNTSFISKWGELIAGKGHTSLPNLLIEHLLDLKISQSEFLVIACILKYKWSDEDPYPSADTLSKLSNLAPGTVRTQIRQLKKRGLIKVVRRTNENNAQQSNGYDFEPLKRKLEIYAQPIRKRSYAYPKTNSRAYSLPDTKEEAANKTQINRRSSNSGKLSSAGDVLKNKYPGIAIRR